jgi:hypothetical protein
MDKSMDERENEIEDESEAESENADEDKNAESVGDDEDYAQAAAATILHVNYINYQSTNNYDRFIVNHDNESTNNHKRSTNYHGPKNNRYVNELHIETWANNTAAYYGLAETSNNHSYRSTSIDHFLHLQA